MIKKLSRHGNSYALVIDKPILKLLKINEDTVLELSIEEGALVMRPVGKEKRAISSKEKRQLIEQIADEIMDEYEEAFKKLAE